MRCLQVLDANSASNVPLLGTLTASQSTHTHITKHGALAPVTGSITSSHFSWMATRSSGESSCLLLFPDRTLPMCRPASFGRPQASFRASFCMCSLYLQSHTLTQGGTQANAWLHAGWQADSPSWNGTSQARHPLLWKLLHVADAAPLHGQSLQLCTSNTSWQGPWVRWHQQAICSTLGYLCIDPETAEFTQPLPEPTSKLPLRARSG